MPNTKSAKKRLRQSLERRTRNRAVRSTLKSEVRKVRSAITGGSLDATKLETAMTDFRGASRKLDKAAASGVIHANAAARMKSRLSAAIKAAKTASAK